MAIEYKMLTEKELNTFINMRINQLREEGAKEDIDLKPALLDYYKRHMKDGLPLMEKILLGQVECHLWRSRLILDVQMER